MSKLDLSWQYVSTDISKIVLNLWVGPQVYADNKEFVAMNYVDAIVGKTENKYFFIKYISLNGVMEQIKNGKRVYIIVDENNKSTVENYVNQFKKN